MPQQGPHGVRGEDDVGVHEDDEGGADQAHPGVAGPGGPQVLVQRDQPRSVSAGDRRHGFAVQRGVVHDDHGVGGADAVQQPVQLPGPVAHRDHVGGLRLYGQREVGGDGVGQAEFQQPVGEGGSGGVADP